jgi:hypothetical protein
MLLRVGGLTLSFKTTQFTLTESNYSGASAAKRLGFDLSGNDDAYVFRSNPIMTYDSWDLFQLDGSSQNYVNGLVSARVATLYVDYNVVVLGSGSFTDWRGDTRYVTRYGITNPSLILRSRSVLESLTGVNTKGILFLIAPTDCLPVLVNNFPYVPLPLSTQRLQVDTSANIHVYNRGRVNPI